MRTVPDALYSIQRYFGMVLPDPWDVRLALEPGVEPLRPFALISLNTLTSSGPPGSHLVTLPLTVHAYPAVKVDMKRSIADELELRNLLWEAAEYGHPGTPAKHRRLPLWDYDPPESRRELDDDGAVVPYRNYCDFLSVATDPVVTSRREDVDPLMMMVALDLRCTFRTGGPVPSAQTIIQRIRASGGPGG